MSKYKEQYLPVAVAAAQKYGLDPVMFAAQIEQESAWNPTAKSKAGASGIAQFMPATAKEMGVNPLDPIAALDASARYMAQLKEKFGTEDLARQAYNGGMGTIQKVLAGKGKLPKETAQYGGLIAQRAAKLQTEVAGLTGGATVAQRVAPPAAGVAAPTRAAGEPGARRVAQGMPVEQAMQLAQAEMDQGLPPGALLPQPDSVAQIQQPDWRQTALAMQQPAAPVMAAAGQSLSDFEVLSQIQDAAARDQDRVLAAMLNDGAPQPEDTGRLPTSVDRYLDKLLA